MTLARATARRHKCSKPERRQTIARIAGAFIMPTL
jgi:hypothetical protein